VTTKTVEGGRGIRTVVENVVLGMKLFYRNRIGRSGDVGAEKEVILQLGIGQKAAAPA
jgi:hypothetical protein